MTTTNMTTQVETIPTPPTNGTPKERDPVMEVCRLELLRVLDEGSPELDAKKLNLVIQLATAARDILSLRNPRARQRCGFGGSSYMPSPMANPWYPDDEELGTVSPTGTIGPFPNPTNNPINNLDRETFGAKVLRELVAVVPEIARSLREDPAQVVKGIAAAREAGLHDVAAELEGRLFGRPPTEPSVEPSVGFVAPQRAAMEAGVVGPVNSGFPQTEAGMRGDVTEATSAVPTGVQ